jgi:hypothetical protein
MKCGSLGVLEIWTGILNSVVPNLFQTSTALTCLGSVVVKELVW